MQDVVVITTFAQDHINLYGKRFVDTFKRYCRYPLYIFAEDFSSDQFYGHTVYDYYKHIPEQLTFKNNILNLFPSLDTKEQNRLRKALRWSYKGFAIWYALKNIDTKYIVWIDADVETLSKIPSSLISSLCEDKLLMCYPQRMKGSLHVESGFVIFNKQHPEIDLVIQHYENGYLNQQVLELSKPWDGFWLGKFIEQSNNCCLERTPFKNIESFFKHYVGKEKFQDTSLNKYSGRKSLT
jgi:hypothetical protein